MEQSLPGFLSAGATLASNRGRTSSSRLADLIRSIRRARLTILRLDIEAGEQDRGASPQQRHAANGSAAFPPALETPISISSTARERPAPSATPSKATSLSRAATRIMKFCTERPSTSHRPKSYLSAATPDFSEQARFARVLSTNNLSTLRRLHVAQTLVVSEESVVGIQFSPDGQFAVTSSPDNKFNVLRVGRDAPISYRTLEHRQGPVRQVAWPPLAGNILLRLDRGIEIWTAEDILCRHKVDCQGHVDSVAWFPGGQAFIVAGENGITKMDLDGNIVDYYNFGPVKLDDAVITPDSSRLIAVKEWRWIAVYDLTNKKLESDAQTARDIQGIRVAQDSRGGTVLLVDYADWQPQLWELECAEEENRTILKLRHMYMPHNGGRFQPAGQSYFGGENDEFVLWAHTAGGIHVWDRDSGALLRYTRHDFGADALCVAWNRAAPEPFTFATGAADGTIRIWTASLVPPGDTSSGSEDPPQNEPDRFSHATI